MTQTMIGPNPNTTPNAKNLLWDAARKGKGAAQRRVGSLRSAGNFTPETALALCAEYGHLVDEAAEGTPDRYRYAAAYSYVIAATRTFQLDTEEN